MGSETDERRPKNVLLVVADDMRPDTSVYREHAGGPNNTIKRSTVHTPHLDALAASRGGVVFEAAYCSIPLCSPSRSSFLSGRVPDRTRVYNLLDDIRLASADGPSWATMPQYFKSMGYLTLGAGKLFHPTKPANHDFPDSWSNETLPYFALEGSGPAHDPLPYICTTKSYQTSRHVKYCPTPINVSESETLWDYRLATRAIELLDLATAQHQPWFLGVGFYHPHLVWQVPEDLYDFHMEGAEDVELYEPQELAPSVPDIAWTRGPMSRIITPDGTLHERDAPSSLYPLSVRAQLAAAYGAAISHFDRQLGRVLHRLDESSQVNRTLIVVTSDHGYHLGEQAVWAKSTLFERATRVPLILRAPWINSNNSFANVASSSGVQPPHRTVWYKTPTSLVDLYRTVADLADVPPPPGDVDGANHGPGVRHVLAPMTNGSSASSSEARPPARTSVLSQMPRCGSRSDQLWYKNSCKNQGTESIKYMGYSIHTNTGWRLTEWFEWDGSRAVLPEGGACCSASKFLELYRYESGSDDETENLAGTEDVAAAQTELREALWTAVAVGDTTGTRAWEFASCNATLSPTSAPSPAKARAFGGLQQPVVVIAAAGCAALGVLLLGGLFVVRGRRQAEVAARRSV